MGTWALYAQCPITVDAGEDIYLCAPPAPTQLNGTIDGDYLNFFWTPTTGMSGSNTLTPTVSVTQTRTYTLTARAVDLTNNLIVNGDFEGGNFGFTSDYIESPGNLVPEGVYEVLDNPQNSHPGFQPCTDHTSGSGNMMAVNGAGQPNLNVWCQTINVMPNTQYAFSAWVATLVAASPALLQFSINGTPLGPIFNAPSQTCVWQNFYSIWNSGNNSSATICIVNQNTVLGGNDFALDDLAFAPLCQVSDSVTVHVVNITAVANPPLAFIPCAGAQFTLSGAGSSEGPDISYQWDTPNGNIVSGANTLSPVIDQAGTYTLTVTFDNGFVNCTKTATVNITESPNPLFTWITPGGILGCNAPTITLIGNSNQPAFSTYAWTTTGGNIVSGADSKNAVIDQPGIYTLLVTNTSTGCTAEAEITITAATDPPTASGFATDTIFNCQSTTFGLDGNGSTQGNNISYAWSAFQGGNILSGADQDSAVADAPGLYVLTVTNETNGCADTDTVIVTGALLPPSIAIQTPDTLNCAIDTLTLTGTVDSGYLSLVWRSFNGGTFTGDSTQISITALSAGLYVLSATGSNHCIGTDTAIVVIDTLAPLAVIAPADTITCQNPTISLSGSGSSTGTEFTYLWTAGSGGNIVSGETTLSPLINAPGVYSLQVTDTSNYCTANATISVVADTNAIVAVANAPDTLSCLAGQVTLNANGSSSGPFMTYAWTTANGLIISGADTPDPLVGAPGTYQLLLTNTVNGCTATDVAIAIQNLVTPNLAISQPPMLTCAAPTISLNGQNLGPAGPYLYIWTATAGGNILSGDSTLSPLIDAPGTYTLEAVHLNSGCRDTASVSVTVAPGTPAAVLATPDSLNCSAPVLTLDAGGSTSGSDFRYAWTASAGGNILSGDTTLFPLINAGGWYTLLVTNIVTGCTAVDSIFVDANFNTPPADAGVPGLLTCNQTVFLLTANPGIPSGNLQFQWQMLQGGNFISDPNNIQVSCDAAGLYQVIVTDPANGCTAADTVTVTSNQLPPTLNIALPDTLDCLQASLNIITSASGTGPDLVFDWETFGGQILSGGNTGNPLIGAPGVYVVTVTDVANGCTNAQSVEVAQDTLPPVLTIDVVPTLTCAQPEAALGSNILPAGGISLNWTTINGQIISGVNTLNPLIGAPGDYTLTATILRNGCTAQLSATVDQNIVPPIVSAGAPDTLDCGVTSISLAGSASGQGVLQYNWTATAGGMILSGSNGLTPQINAAGIYTLQVTDSQNGCTAINSVQIFNDANAPAADAGPSDTLTCAQQLIVLQGSGSQGPGFQYSWTAGPGGNILSGNTTLSPQVNAPGTYQLEITNLNNGCTAISSVIMGIDTLSPQVDAGPGALLSCNSTSLVLTGSATAPGNSLQFNWSTTNGNILNGGTTLSPLVDRVGTYLLAVTNLLNGCTASDVVTVGIDTTAPVLTAAPPQELNCLVLQINIPANVLQPLSNYAAQWTTANGNILSGAGGLSPVVDAPGDYLLTVQDLQNGCTATLAVPVTENITPPLAAASTPGLLNCLQTQITLDGTGSSTGAEIQYFWTAGPGGIIDNGANSLMPQVSAPGIYTILVTDTDNGCTATAQINVGLDTVAPVIAVAPPLLLTCLRDTVIIDASASSQGTAFQYSWNAISGHLAGGNNTLFPSVDQPGTYRLLIANLNNGCTATATVNVSEDRQAPQVSAGPDQLLHCNKTSAVLQGTASGAATPVFAWTTLLGSIASGANTPSPLVTAPGSYILTATNLQNGCSATDEVLVTEAPLPEISATLQQPDCFQSRGVIQIQSSGVPPLTYSDNGGLSYQSESTFTNRAPGDYLLVVRDNYGCTAGAGVTVEPPFIPTLSLPTWLVMELGDSVRLEPATNIPPGQVADWQWTPTDGLSCSDCERPWTAPFRSSRYHLTVTDLNGCTAEASVTIQVDRSRNVYPPNIFSPNGDGLNDRFTIYGRAVTEIKLLQVYDRWGNQLFLGERLTPGAENEGWDGTFRGQEMSPGVYVWVAVLVFVDGEELVLSGDVTIVR